MTTHVRVSGSWREISNIYVRVSGSWRQLSEMYVRVSGSWRRVFVLVVPGSINYTSAGTNTFTVPPYNSLTARVWGAGGGSIGRPGNDNAGNGQSSYFTGSGASLTANGGARGRNAGGSASGGNASGGSTNSSGTSGGGVYSFQGAVGETCSQVNWGSATLGRGGGSPNGGATIPGRGNSGPGINGNSPGGGAAGAASCGVQCILGGANCRPRVSRMPGGGGGGYCTRTWTKGQLTVGASISVRSGQRGAAGTYWGSAGYNGGHGAHGRVSVQWS